MTVALATLLTKSSKAEIYATGLGIATSLGLPVSSWQAGDPTRSLYHLEAEILAAVEDNRVGFIASGFLDLATGVWLRVLAEQVYNVYVPDATRATTDVTLTNGGTRRYPGIVAGDLTFKSSVSGKTYHNITGGTLESGGTLTVTVEADEPGSGSTAGPGEIDSLITTRLGVTCSNATAAIGLDEQAESVTRQQCRDKLDSLSPNGPKGAYSYVARNSQLTGSNATTRVRVYAESDIGKVTVYLAGPSGGVPEPDRVLVETAILQWATPLCITPVVLAASTVTIAVTYELWAYKSVNRTEDEIKADVEAALETMIASRPIGGDIIPPSATGYVFASRIESAIRSVYPEIFRVIVTLPSGDTAVANSEVPILGTITPTVHLVVDP